ncbi:histidinol-phosphate transaminase [Nitratireductor sp. GCM10026969]|uniref:histidinol-phosphate transaminase n=1 Tax=Nitratireductor sp. GCM10026969 TaxID=3252645 RepID=UPI003613C1F3
MSGSFHLIRPEVQGLSPYNAGLTLAEVKARHDPPRIAKLGSNENPLGPSSKVDALAGELRALARHYPDPSGTALAAAIAEAFSLMPGQVILGNGSEDLIAVICRTVLRPGDRVVTLYPSFPLHEDYAAIMGARVERVGLNDDLTIDVDKLLSVVRAPARMVIFSNPMNPVGSWLDPAALGRVVDALHPDTLLVVDEAYAEYATGEDYSSALSLLEGGTRPRIVLRTFSKAYGLAGFRIGFGLVSEPGLRAYLDRARTPFNTNALAQAAARVALGDTEHLARVVALAVSERQRVSERLAAMGLRTAPSKGNFLFVDMGGDAAAVSEKLLRHGVIVKPWRQEGYRSFMRVTVGSREENDHFLEALGAVREP